MTIPVDVREQIKASHPDAVVARVAIETVDDHVRWGEIEVTHNGEHLALTVADTPEGWERAIRSALAWLGSLA
jgi:hypothetical protein